MPNAAVATRALRISITDLIESRSAHPGNGAHASPAIAMNYYLCTLVLCVVLPRGHPISCTPSEIGADGPELRTRHP